MALAILLAMVPGQSARGRGGGGCFEQGTPILTSTGNVPIEQLKPGDTVVAVDDGKLRRATVQCRVEVQPEEYLELTIAGQKLRVTPEHPFAIGPGEFREASRLHAGDTLLWWDGRQLRKTALEFIGGVEIRQIDIVNVRYTHKPNDREFTALITASARDYYIDERTQEFLRGDTAPATFQEFWTFHLMDGKWLLREIEQTRESDALKDENFFEPFTDQGVEQVYGEAAGQEGPSGPWLEKQTETKATRIERLLNFLVQTDKIWNRQAMQERSRQVFIRVFSAWETGDPVSIPAADLFPEYAAQLTAGIGQQRADHVTVEYRNLCVRKVELILVRNFADNNRDEFTVRISAHAQYIVQRESRIVRQDDYVSPFMEYWTFGRRDSLWKLKAVLPPAEGETAMTRENVDEESSSEQLQWYYQKTRAV